MSFGGGSGWIYLASILLLQDLSASCGNVLRASAGFIRRRLILYTICT